jgi:phosphoadenosine phosphosulfate reductase
MPIWQETLTVLRGRARISDSCLVSYSGGKDSLAVLDLCARSFKRIICFYMFLVPGLDVIERQMEYARERWKVQILYYPHRAFFTALKEGTFCKDTRWNEELPMIKLRELYDWVVMDTGIPQIATGAKSSDSMARRRFFKNTESWDDVFYPLKGWNKHDVLAYCRAQGIILPDAHKGNTTGVDLSTRSLLWLHDTYPDDFQKLCQWFPFAEAVVKRREFYGIGSEKETHSQKLAKARQRLGAH